MIVFISDLHLPSTSAHYQRLFDTFIERYARQASAVYILGDLFNYWIGDDIPTPMSQYVCEQLASLVRQGIACYFMPGNRDFLVGQAFATASGCRLLADPTIIDLYGQRTLLMHGDSLCTQDENYNQFRQKVRDPARQQRFLAKPAWLRRLVARCLRLRSQLYNRTQSLEIMDVTPAAVIAALAEADSLLLIHGHTHRPAQHDVIVNGRHGKRIVLDAWHNQGNGLICLPDGQMELVYF